LRTTDLPAKVDGLSERQALRIRAEVGPNTIPEPPRPGTLSRVLAQLRDPMIMLLLGAAALSIALRDLTDTMVITIVVVLNTAVGVIQELRAEQALAALGSLSAPHARVVRDGHWAVRPAAELVPGDVTWLEAGDVVPADAKIEQGHRLQVDEAALTGESVPVDKDSAAGEVFAGTVVTRGRAVVVVTRTGPSSSLGRIAALLGEQRPRPTPLQRRLAALGRVLAIAALLLSALVAVVGLARGRPLGDMVLTAVSLAVAAVPESLPAVVTLALALGAHHMAKHAAVVRRLPAVETLGSVTVVAVDKTGTLTEGRMLVERLWTPTGGEFTVSGSGYEPTGQISPPDPAGALTTLLRDVVLCNDSELLAPDGDQASWRPMGDPTEAALVVAAAKAGVPAESTRASFPRLAELPFDSETKRMVTVHGLDDGLGGVLDGGPGCVLDGGLDGGRRLVVCKGAPEVLLDTPGLLVPGPDVERAREVSSKLAQHGYRVLAVADLVADPRVTGTPEPQRQRGLRLAGLVAITDPPRPDAAQVVRTFQGAGVELVLVTGDHPWTARALASRVGITDEQAGADVDVVTGAELSAGLSAERADTAKVFARTRPEQKLDIIAARQRRGHVVAMTGDGVNDAPALRRADIGVAMGGGTEVARQAADLVLTDDNLATMTIAISEGRRIYANVRTFLRYALSGGVAEVAVMLLAPLLGLAVPLLPAQILWINMLTHGLPGVAIGAEPAGPGILRRPPRPPDEFVLGGGLWLRVAWTGALITAVTLGAGWWSYGSGGPWQTMVFLTLGLAQLGVAVALRRRGGGWRPRFLDLAVAGAVLLQLAALFVPALRTLLGTEPLDATGLAVAAMAATLPGLAVAAIRALGRRQVVSM
jgi:Ca2+-transporting ATPase